MVKSILHFIQRSRDLGPMGTLQQTWARSANWLVTESQSLWWDLKSRQEMSDSVLLSHTTGDWQSMDDLITHLTSRLTPSYLLPHESVQETTQLLRQNFPEYINTLLAEADAACRNEISLLGQIFHYPHGIDWNSDPITGRKWPLLHKSRIDKVILSPDSVDIIPVWELNRHQHFINLGIAYWLTGNQKYVNAFISQIQHWIDDNPIQHGVNWYSSLEISIRLINWTVAFQFFRNSHEFREKIGKAFLKSLWQQVDFLSNHLQNNIKTDVPNNHLIGELAGMILVGSVFPEFRKSAVWYETSFSLLSRQVSAQTHSDGVNKEQASGYHRFVAELLLLIVIRSRHGAFPKTSILEEILEKMLDYVLYSLSPVGTMPMWGDSASGRVFAIGQEKNFWDFRPILSAGAVLFNRTDLKLAAGRFDEEAFWLLGSDGLKRWNELDAHLPEKTSKAFPQGGLFIIRDEWNADTDVAFFRCGSFGLGGEAHCAHSHCDLLSFVLWVKGKPLLVDSGTYTYHGPLRDHFRLTAAHNTATIDGREQALPNPQFNWQQIPMAQCVDWNENRVIGSLTYSNQVKFIRELSHPEPGIWEIYDTFIGQGKTHEVSWYFHFASDLTLFQHEISKNLVVKDNGKPYVEVIPPQDISIEFKSDWVSDNYGKKELNPMLHCIWRGEIPNSGTKFCWKFISAEKNIKVER